MAIDGDDAGAGPAADRAASRRCGDPIAVYFFVLVCVLCGLTFSRNTATARAG